MFVSVNTANAFKLELNKLFIISTPNSRTVETEVKLEL